MQPRISIPLSITLITLLLVASYPITGNSESLFKRSVAYRIGGHINISSEVGSPFETGSSRLQTIRGSGELTKSETVKIAPYIMRMEDNTRWLTYQDAVRNISVITTIQLCARPVSAAVYTYDTGNRIIQPGDIINPYLPIVVDGNIILNPLSRQIWHTRISSDPGHHGTYKAEYISAYGPGAYEVNRPNYDSDHSWWFEGITGVGFGDYYVGNYFEIDQYIHTSRGDTRRLIDMSSPFSHARYKEELRVIGSLTIWEDFEMRNILMGRDAITMHWSDFDLFF